jgi:hypothetical protein
VKSMPEFQSCSQFGGESHTTANSGEKKRWRRQATNLLHMTIT